MKARGADEEGWTRSRGKSAVGGVIIQDGGVGSLCRLLGFGMMTDCLAKGRARDGWRCATTKSLKMESVLTKQLELKAGLTEAGPCCK